MARDLFGLETRPQKLRRRLFLERFATDSYQNILFSLLQFPAFVQTLLQTNGDGDSGAGATANAFSTPNSGARSNAFPSKLVIISHEFKRARFENLHLPAMKWHGQTRYIGINPPFDQQRMVEIEQGDRKRGYGAWEKDLYGNGSLLCQKRLSRGYDLKKVHDQVLQYYDEETKRTLVELLSWNGSSIKEVFPKPLPWE